MQLNHPFVKDIASRQSTNYDVKVIADTSNGSERLITLQLMYPRFIHAEMMTHRMFSRNASSSRARPVATELERIRVNPAIPIYWGKNKSGMQANSELKSTNPLFQPIDVTLREAWLASLDNVIRSVEYMQAISEANAGATIHKQTVNRLLEPYQLIESVFTGNIEAFEAFFNLRIHPDAQPEIIKLACMMYEAIEQSDTNHSKYHLPYIDVEEVSQSFSIEEMQRISAARCARVSYKLFDGTTSYYKDLELADKLFNRNFPHASPAEHPAIAREGQFANFTNFQSYRNQLGL